MLCHAIAESSRHSIREVCSMGAHHGLKYLPNGITFYLKRVFNTAAPQAPLKGEHAVGKPKFVDNLIFYYRTNWL